MDTYEIPVIGQGDLLINVFRAVALLSNNVTMASMLYIVGLFGAFIALYSLATKASYANAGRWLLLYIFVFGGMFVPRVNVVVNDASDPTVGTQVISNVPIGVALPAYVSTTFGNRIALSLDTVLTPPDTFNYRDNKSLWGPRLMKELGEVTITDARTAQNVNNFFELCVFPEISNNGAEFDKLGSTNELWPFVERYVSLGKTTDYLASGEGAVLTQISCNESYENINTDLTGAVNDAAKYYSAKFYPEHEDETARAISFLSDTSTTHTYYMNISRDGSEVLRQALLLNQFQRAQSGLAATGGESSLMNFAQVRARTLFATTAGTIGSLMQSAIPLLYTLIIILLVAIFPIVIIIAMLPNIGLNIIKNYLTSFFYIQAYPVLFIIFNSIINFELVRRSRAAFSQTDNIDGGLTLIRAPFLNEIPSEVAATAAIFLTLIPLLMKIFTQGVSAVSGGLESVLQSYQSSANTAANEVASGNLAFGTTTYATAQAHNFNTNVRSQAGEYSYNTRSGSQITKTADGSTIINNQPAISRLGTSASQGKAYSSAISAARSQSQQAISESAKVRSESQRALSNEVLSYALSKGNGHRGSKNEQFSNIQGVNEEVGGIQSQVETWASTHGISTSQAYSRLFSAAGKVGIKLPKGFLGPVSADGSVTAGVSDTKTSTASENDSVAESFLSSLQNRESLNDASQAILSYASNNENFADQRFSDTVTKSIESIKSADATTRAANSTIDSANKLEQQSVNTSGSLNFDVSNDIQSLVSAQYGKPVADEILSNPNDSRFKPVVTQAFDQLIDNQLGENFDNVQQFNESYGSQVDSIAKSNEAAFGSAQPNLTDRTSLERFGDYAYGQLLYDIDSSRLTGSGSTYSGKAVDQANDLRGSELYVPNSNGGGTTYSFNDGGGLNNEISDKNDVRNKVTDTLDEGASLSGAFGAVNRFDDGSPKFPDPIYFNGNGIGKFGPPDGAIRLPEEFKDVAPDTRESGNVFGKGYNNVYYNEDAVNAYAAAAKEWEAEQASNLENFVKGPRITRGNE